MAKFIHFENSNKVAIVDDEDFDRISRYKWYYNKGHAMTTIDMSRMILDDFTSEVIDHKNVNGIDNQKLNLRPCTHTDNRINRKKRNGTTSKYKGVSFHKNNEKWRATIMKNGKRIYLGEFKNEVNAAKAYDRIAKTYHGEFAILNFPEVI